MASVGNTLEGRMFDLTAAQGAPPGAHSQQKRGHNPSRAAARAANDTQTGPLITFQVNYPHTQHQAASTSNATPYARFASLALCSWAFKAAFFSFTLGERDLDILLASRIKAWCTLSEP